MLQTFLTSNIVEISQNFKSIFFDNLTLITIIIWFEKYFKNQNAYKYAWIQDPVNTIAPSECISIGKKFLLFSCFATKV